MTSLMCRPHHDDEDELWASHAAFLPNLKGFYANTNLHSINHYRHATLQGGSSLSLLPPASVTYPFLFIGLGICRVRMDVTLGSLSLSH